MSKRPRHPRELAIDEARDLLAKLVVISESRGTDFQAKEMVSTSKPEGGPPSPGGETYVDEALAIYRDANGEVRQLLKRARRLEAQGETAASKRFWLLASHEGQSSRHVADITDYSPAQVRRFRREAGRDEETGLPIDTWRAA